MFLNLVSLCMALALAGPFSSQHKANYLREKYMPTPINYGLDSIKLPTAASTELVKILVVGDSQSLRQGNRWFGQTISWPVKHTGSFLGCVNQQDVGQFFSNQTQGGNPGFTFDRKDGLGDDWGASSAAADMGDHIIWGGEWDFTGTPTSFTELGRLSRYKASYAVATDIDARKHFRIGIRDHPDNMARVRIESYSVSTLAGDADDFGVAAWDPTPPGDFDADGTIKTIPWSVPSSATLGSAGNNTRGVVIRHSNQSTSSKELHILGALEYDSASSDTMPSTGLITASMSTAGASVRDHVVTETDRVRDWLVAAAEGFDLVIFMFGHNAEDNGDANFKANIAEYIGQINDAHDNASASHPDYLLVAPWQATGTAMDEDKADDMYDLAVENGYGFISLWHSYGGANPSTLTERLDGTSATYTMDPTLHPGNSTTGQHMAQDFWWHFQPENFVPAESQRKQLIRRIILMQEEGL